MNDIQKRFLLFLILCIGIRFLFVYLAKTLHKKYVKIMALPAIIIGLGFIFIFLTGSRTSGKETFGRKIWWNILRPIHGFLYLYFAYLAFSENNLAFIPLLIDVILGLIAFLTYHYNNNSFYMLF